MVPGSKTASWAAEAATLAVAVEQTREQWDPWRLTAVSEGTMEATVSPAKGCPPSAS